MRNKPKSKLKGTKKTEEVNYLRRDLIKSFILSIIAFAAILVINQLARR